MVVINSDLQALELIMNARTSLKDEVVSQLPWLFKVVEFRIVEERHEPESFGNSFVILESSELRIRFIRDRGQIFADVASCIEPEQWWNLIYNCELLKSPACEPGCDLWSVATLLRRHLPEVLELLGPKFPETKRELERRAEGREQALRSRFFFS
jgi:hypothetical protein